MGIYMTRWGYIQGKGRLGKGGVAALKPDLAKESILAGIPISPPPQGEVDMGNNFYWGPGTEKRRQSALRGSQAPEKLRAS